MATAPRKQPPLRVASDSDADRDRKGRGLKVRMMQATKTPIKAIAEMMGVSVAELRRTYKRELADGHDYVYAAMSQKLVAAGIGGDVRSMLAWLRQFGGWQEITRREVTGKDGAPISFQNLDSEALNSVISALSNMGQPRITGRGPDQKPVLIDVDPD